MDADNEYLKPCPFCGGEAHIGYVYALVVAVQCTVCGAIGSLAKMHDFRNDAEGSFEAHMYIYAAGAWNRRSE